tara:strand:+ start:642 stop:812 length:171 start_codon:yes stop_codon:yes gene_type:complete
MNIVTAKYRVYPNGEKTVQVIDDKDKLHSIPMNENNVEYKIVLQWVADGNTIQEAD